MSSVTKGILPCRPGRAINGLRMRLWRTPSLAQHALVDLRQARPIMQSLGLKIPFTGPYISGGTFSVWRRLAAGYEWMTSRPKKPK